MEVVDTDQRVGGGKLEVGGWRSVVWEIWGLEVAMRGRDARR